jgi:flagellin FlaB
MVLIAAVAAGVLISTTSSLQTKALETGKATRQEVVTNLNVLEVYGEDGSNNDLENLSLVVRLSAVPTRLDLMICF